MPIIHPMKILPPHVQDKANGPATREMALLLPDLELPPQQPLGRWARPHLRHLQAHHPAHAKAAATGTPSEYLHTVDQQASERYDTLMKGYAKSWEITESLKSEDPMSWSGACSGAVRSRAQRDDRASSASDFSPSLACGMPAGGGTRFSRGGISHGQANARPHPFQRRRGADSISLPPATRRTTSKCAMRTKHLADAKTMAWLYDVDVSTINEHIKNLFRQRIAGFSDPKIPNHCFRRKTTIPITTRTKRSSPSGSRSIRTRRAVPQMGQPDRPQYTIRGWVMTTSGSSRVHLI